MVELIAVIVVVLILIRLYHGPFTSGMDGAEVISRDRVLLKSENLGLSGRPDRLERLRSGAVIPFEMKSGKRRKLYDSHLVQIGVYLLLVEDVYGQRPPYGFVVFGDGSKAKVSNTARLRRWTLDQAQKLREQRANLDVPRRVRPKRWLCKNCSVRHACTQRA